MAFTKSYSEPTRNFYIAASPMYSMWAIFTLGFLPFEKFGYWLVVSLCRRLKYKKCVIQKDLENTLRRKQFDITHKVPYLLGLATVVFFFVGGIPFMMIMFGTFAMIYYWIEKLMVLKFYRKPGYLDETSLRFADYIILGIFIMHLIVSIVMYGTADVFPKEATRTRGFRKGYVTSYYEIQGISFFEKFGLLTNLGHLLLLIFVIIFIILTLVFRNKIWCRKFKYFPIKYSVKMKHIPGTFARVKDN